MDTKIQSNPAPLAGRSTAEALAQRLREAILSGTLPGGQPLRQEELAEQFGTSRLPVREALWQLSAEGLVALTPNRGAVVTRLSADEVEEIFDIRGGLESTALRLAIPQLSPAILAQARAILREIDQEPDSARWDALNWSFHAALYAPAQRPRLLAMIRAMHDNVGRYMRMYLALMNFQARSQAEHYAILGACERYDSAAAIELLTQHLNYASTQLSSYLREHHSGER